MKQNVSYKYAKINNKYKLKTLPNENKYDFPSEKTKSK